MSTLTFLKYNNYYNRTLKGWEDTSTSNYSSFSPKAYSNLNFDPKDGIDTVHYINDSVLTDFKYDYMLVSDDNSTTIKSKWFVIDAVWNRRHQWRIVLHRDVLADKWNMYKDNPFFCRKGLPTVSSPLVYNSEGMQFNQILKERSPLKASSTQTKRYIVGFMDKKWPGGKVYETPIYTSYENLEAVPVSKWVGRTYINPAFPAVVFDLVESAEPSGDSANGTGRRLIIPMTNSSIITTEAINTNFESQVGRTDTSTSAAITTIKNAGTALKASSHFNDLCAMANLHLDKMRTASIVPENISEINHFWDLYQNKPIQVGDKVYVFNFTISTGKLIDKAYINEFEDGGDNPARIFAMEGKDWLRSLLSASSGLTPPGNIWSTGDENSDSFLANLDSVWATWGGSRITVSMTEQTTTIDIPSPSSDLPLPYNIWFIEDSEEARRFAGYFATQFGQTFLYDMQLFPFEPPFNPNDTPYTIATGVYLYWANGDSKSGTLYHTLTSRPYTSAEDKKVGANQELCRIIAPNGASAWEFNPATIGGIGASTFKYEFTLMPFSSYLHIFPKFDKLYGTINKIADNNTVAHPEIGESRGIVCEGPWSIPYSTDNWSTYQLQNSAYKSSFDRTIENMTITQDVEKTKEKWQVGLGTIQSGISGAAAGGTTGAAAGPIGAAVGAAVGGTVGVASSALGGMMDIELNNKLRAEQIDYTKDQFYNSLRNIQAQSRPLVHSSSTSIGCSYFPIVEYYSADMGSETTIKDCFLNDLRYHGWTMGIKTTVNDLKNNIKNYDGDNIPAAPTRYVQGDLINVDVGTYGDDYHIAKEIAKELNLGVYLWQI